MPPEPAQKLVLVTGGAGFVGSHLCERLAKDGHRVISLDNYFAGSRENHVEGVEYREGHTKDVEALVPEAPDIVYHLGEYSRVEKSFEDIEAVWDLNKLGTFAVLEFVRRRGSKIVYAGSSTKFGDGWLGRDQSPYAWTKATNTELVRDYGAWYGIPYAITYFYNVYGPGERAGAMGTVIEIFRQNRLAGKPLSVVAPGTQVRNFTHIDDIVDGLLLVGEKGEGDEFGLGDDRAYSILDVAGMFGGEIVMLPERQGNRLTSSLDAARARALGWEPKRHLEDYIRNAIANAKPTSQEQPRVLAFTTTFHPIEGPAERALGELIAKTPDIHFDIVTAAHAADALAAGQPHPNATVYRIGRGTRFDKYLLPFAGVSKALSLAKRHRYLFAWSVMASYGAIPALFVKGRTLTPLLVTLADQDLSWHERLFLRFVIGRADQVYVSSPEQEKKLISLEARMRARKSLGSGDAFANQLRFSYSQILAGLKRRDS
jgi:UDP-glucose 4-epimerase